MTFDEVDSVPQLQAVREPVQFVAGELRTTLTPRTLERAEWFIYRMILDNPDRPIHFANSSGDYVTMELADYAVMHGLTRKLMREPVEETDTIKRARSGAWVDVHASTVLWDSFEAPAALIRKNKWIDRPSLPSPTMYVRTGLTLSDSMLMRGDAAGALRVYERTRAIAEAIQVMDYFPPPPSQLLGDPARDAPEPGPAGATGTPR
jgi:hypothetical protein